MSPAAKSVPETESEGRSEGGRTGARPTSRYETPIPLLMISFMISLAPP